MTLDDVEDIETLRRAAKTLEAEVQTLSKMVLTLRRELHELKHGKHGRPEQLELELARLEEQLAARNKMLFGDKSEKSKRSNPKAARKKQTGHGRREQPELQQVEQVHVADIGEDQCDVCGGSLSEWEGQLEESEEIDILERRFVLKKHRRQKYKCKCGSCIKTARGPRKLFDGARYSVGFAMHVAMAKYADHLPLERQVKGMKRDGLLVDSQTLWDQINALAALLTPAYERQKSYLLAQPVIGADETFWRLMGEKGKKQGGKGKRWQIWATVCSDAVHYAIKDSRSAEAAKEVLGCYDGIVMADDYAAYSSVQRDCGFILAHCWLHVRRKFVELEEVHPGQAEGVLKLIGQLYGIEHEARGRPPDEVLALRQDQSKPIVLAIQKWALEQEALPESGLMRAIKYMGGVWHGLQVFLSHPEVELDNNRTERALRGVVVGRKNHYGSRSRRGTEVAAVFYTLIESAKLAGIGPGTYLERAVDAALRGDQVPLPHELA